ncbi:MAG: ATP-binding cassette domain-containing protein [Bradymonadaceae bacterium]|nr:ATP-binding cassette domain-containing protein [Lujinxingiaceae bacterium]
MASLFRPWGGPAVVVLDADQGPQLVLVVKGRASGLEVVGLDLERRTLGAEVLHEALCARGEAPHRLAIEGMLDAAGVPTRRRKRALEAILRERLAPGRLRCCYLLRQPASAPFIAQLQRQGAGRRLSLLLALNFVRFGLFLFAWWLIGRGALSGTLEQGWLAGWVLVLLSMVLVQMLATWTEGLLALWAAVALKARLLTGALRLEPSTIRDQGAGQLLGQVFESEAVEAMSINGGFRGLSAVIELAIAAVILGLGPAPGVQLPLFGLWVGLVVLVWWQLYDRMKRWTEVRVSMTEDLVERMVGHRTRLAQQVAARRHDGEDERMTGYLEAPQAMDLSQVLMRAFLSLGWLIVGVAGLLPVFIADDPLSVGALAVGLGGVLLAGQALASLGGGLASMAQAAIAWRKTAILFQAASREEDRPAPEARIRSEAAPARDGQILVEAHELLFRHPGRPQPVLRGCSMTIARGERILLEGRSGSGKSTLGSILVGLRKPDAGLLLLDGLDRQTLGLEGWQQKVVSVPQFHENHILTGPLAFNALMGHEWPASAADMARAQEVFEVLGLGELLARMPSGLLQMVGDTGWQLSHGERSRLFIARALLQNPQMIVFDESFAALDPENTRRALDCVLERAPTVVVIAHP